MSSKINNLRYRFLESVRLIASWAASAKWAADLALNAQRNIPLGLRLRGQAALVTRASEAVRAR